MGRGCLLTGRRGGLLVRRDRCDQEEGTSRVCSSGEDRVC